MIELLKIDISAMGGIKELAENIRLNGGKHDTLAMDKRRSTRDIASGISLGGGSFACHVSEH